MKPFCKTPLLCMFAFLFMHKLYAQTTVTLNLETQTSVTKSGTIKGDLYIDYKFNASAGSKASISLKTSNTANYFNVLPPGSNDVAVYNSSINGNSYSGELSEGGIYTIRVYLMRSAARRNEQGKYTLSITINPSKTTASGDAKVGNTKYNATGKLRYTAGNDAEKMVDFGVVRYKDKSAEITVMPPDVLEIVLLFNNGEWHCKREDCKLKYTRTGDEWKITVNDYEKIIIPEAVVYGG